MDVMRHVVEAVPYAAVFLIGPVITADIAIRIEIALTGRPQRSHGPIALSFPGASGSTPYVTLRSVAHQASCLVAVLLIWWLSATRVLPGPEWLSLLFVGLAAQCLTYAAVYYPLVRKEPAKPERHPDRD